MDLLSPAIPTDNVADEPPATIGDAYRAAARRLRHRLRRRPAVLHQALCDLSRSHDSELRRDNQLPAPIAHGPAACFAALAAERLEGGLLRYSERRRLLASAADMCIGRFEANLLIALVQHRATPGQSSPTLRRPTALPAVALVIAVQCLVFLGVWWLLHA